MSEAAEPFEERPIEPSAFGGCSRPLLIGCGVAVLVLAAAALLLIVKAEDLFRWTFARAEEAILETMPPEVEEAEVERLRRAFDGVERAVTEGRIDTRSLQELQSALSTAARKGDRLTREDVLRLTEALERVAGEPADEAAVRGPLPQFPAAAA